MKFRTDFVTNSSDSSFMAFNIKNKRLFNFLTDLGIQIQYAEEDESLDNVVLPADGELSDDMEFTLPTGESGIIDGSEHHWLPFPNAYKSLSAWMLGTVMLNFHDADKVFEEAGILPADLEIAEDGAIDAFEDIVGHMDGDITEAVVERGYGFEGELEALEYVEIQGGNRLSILCDEDAFSDSEVHCEGLTFVITGNPKYFEYREAMVEYIENLGGVVAEEVSESTSFLICADINLLSSQMQRAKSLCVPILTEEGFIRRFSDPDQFELEEDDDELPQWFDTLFDGGVYRMFQRTGIGKTRMQIWKDGRWVDKS